MKQFKTFMKKHKHGQKYEDSPIGAFTQFVYEDDKFPATGSVDKIIAYVAEKATTTEDFDTAAEAIKEFAYYKMTDGRTLAKTEE